jgi:hypothetical protein
MTLALNAKWNVVLTTLRPLHHTPHAVMDYMDYGLAFEANSTAKRAKLIIYALWKKDGTRQTYKRSSKYVYIHT